MNVASSDGGTGSNVSINFDVHDISDGIYDSWLFLGDSITAGGMNNCYGTGFATYVNQLDCRYFPIQENGGIGGIRSVDGRENIDRWLSVYSGKYVSIAYGTNDAWGNDGSGAEAYYENTKYMIDAVLAAGKIPVLPKIPYSTNADVNGHLDDFNGMIDRLYKEYDGKLIQGPDFETYFRENPDGLSGDGVHPSSEGYDAMRQIWAKTMYETVYKAAPDDTDPLYGDADCDGQVFLNDAVLVMQAIGNPDEYGVEGSDPSHITEEGKINADVSGNSDGLTNMDALAIQKYIIHLIDELPE